MPYRPEHKAQTRRRIITAARGLFNARGFDGVSIDEIMAAAGLTRGGFYNHFRTKDELHAEAVMSARERYRPENCATLGLDPAATPEVFASQIVAIYLSDEHLADPGNQCPLFALPSDIARAGPKARAAYEKLLRGMSRIFARGMGGAREDRRALAVAALCIGGMTMARAVDDAALGKDIRAAAREAALDLGGFAPAKARGRGRRRATPSRKTRKDESHEHHAV